jgi:tetrahydromethanopterin S-methyltransferase subunit G
MAVMMGPRDRWTDERLDDLDKKVDRGIAELKSEMKEGFERMEARFGERFDAIGERFDAVDKRFDAVDNRFDAVDKRLVRLEDAYFTLNRTTWTVTCMIIAGLIGTGAFG